MVDGNALMHIEHTQMQSKYKIMKRLLILDLLLPPLKCRPYTSRKAEAFADS